ncbi:MAG: hypothetical protein PHD82_13710, partial [Candidatus Riflebacteria bacterium]|nr:hypothetical protein [Candidatus Riflebacteria bacterium]
ESVSTQPGRIRCPIIEVQLESIVKPEPVNEKPADRQPRDNRGPRDKRDSRDNRADRQQNDRQQPTAIEQQKSPTPLRPAGSGSDVKADNQQPTGITGVSQDLLFALKEAIVHECLSTMHKRCNKYVRKGLWRWIEREIMDPNVHFYLIILSSIYQGKTGEILSRRFKSVEDYSNKPEEVIQAIFSRENNLADEIKKDSDRHRRALTKFLVCFSQTPPFEYLKSVFLKDFRSFNDGLKARMSVYSTLEQLLDRCGFEGEKETRYPLEILDELKIFQGIMTGNYICLRTDNAAKKLKHLVPQVEWSNDDIYSLRNQLAKALNLPAQEFNLNAFLPQAFFQDAKIMAESRKEAIRAPNQQLSRPQPAAQAAVNAAPETMADERVNLPRSDANAGQQPQNQSDGRPSRRDRKNDFFEKRKAEKLARQQQNRQVPQVAPEEDFPARVVTAEVEPEAAERARPINAGNLIDNRSAQPAEPSFQRDSRYTPECDESQHRYFENFGGHLEEDTDAIKLALAMVRHEQERAEHTAAAISARKPVANNYNEDDEEPDLYRPPVKSAAGRAPISVNQVPPRRVARPTGPDGQPSGQRPDRKRRFSRNSQNRNRPRRPGTPGVNR